MTALAVLAFRGTEVPEACVHHAIQSVFFILGWPLVPDSPAETTTGVAYLRTSTIFPAVKHSPCPLESLVGSWYQRLVRPMLSSVPMANDVGRPDKPIVTQACRVHTLMCVHDVPESYRCSIPPVDSPDFP